MELISLVPLAAIWVPLFEYHLRPEVFLIRLSLEPKYLAVHMQRCWKCYKFNKALHMTSDSDKQHMQRHCPPISEISTLTARQTGSFASITWFTSHINNQMKGVVTGTTDTI
jgi:hypothetical protein